MGIKHGLQSLYRYLFKSSVLDLQFQDAGLHDADEIRSVIEEYANKNGQALEYQQREMPIRFTLDGVPYVVTRGWSRGGPVVGARRDYDAPQ